MCCHRCCPTVLCGGCTSGHTGAVLVESLIQVTLVIPVFDKMMNEFHNVNVTQNFQVSGHKTGGKKKKEIKQNSKVRLENSSFIVLNKKISITAYFVSEEGLQFSV